ncbi:penicillin-binding protein activator [Ectothiorhodospiraceae bacterium WFHF3C12]|nr:penicillin-binding protein activator [Ectothiorhodospiraceae bacterium WFHF3C12]
MRSRSNRASLILGVAGALLLAGCAAPPPKPSVTPEPAEREPAMAEEARRALALDRPLEAAALFETAAEQTQSPLRDRYLVRAAGIYARGGDVATAQRLIEDVDATVLTGEHRHRLTLIRARIELGEDKPEAAWQRLEEQPDNLPESLARDWRDAQASALYSLGRQIEAARIRIGLAQSMAPGAARERQFRLIWEGLSRLSPARLAAVMPSGSATLDGWLVLATRFRENRIDAPALRQAVAQWRQRYPDHPANRFAGQILADHLERLRPPEEIALMLPLSGRLAGVGQAIMHGFMAAYFQDTAPRPRVRVFDVGESGKDVVSAYRDAVEAGMDLVVGPLTKQSLEMLSVWDTFPVPVLALNTVGGEGIPRDRFFQFGLAPEDDARAAAGLMAAQGHEAAVALVPNSEWGDRVAGAFRASLEARGGRVLEQAYYQPQASDFGAPLTRLFNLDASRARYGTLRRVLSAEIEFEPRRRQDMDAVFFAAYPQQARLIRPQIRFHHGIGLPVYATSHAYSGSPQPNDDQDMDGLRIVDIPWLMAGTPALDAALSLNAMQALWPQESKRLPRLVAMGIDAYRLAPVVDVLRQYPGDGMASATGVIHVAGDGVIHRLLPAGAFRDGRLVPLALDGEPFGMPRP